MFLQTMIAIAAGIFAGIITGSVHPDTPLKSMKLFFGTESVQQIKIRNHHYNTLIIKNLTALVGNVSTPVNQEGFTRIEWCWDDISTGDNCVI